MKKSQFTSRLGNNQGQAMIEYVLMLIISVSIVLMLMTQIFKPFGEFIDNYMGKYVACLLEYGELPSMGSQEGSPVEEDSECNKRFQSGTLAGGRPPAQNANDSSNKSSSDGDSSSSAGAGGGGTYAGSASRRGGSKVNFGRRPSSGIDAGSAAGGGKVVEIALDSGGNGGFFRASTGGQYRGPQRKQTSVPLSGLSESERKKLEKKADGKGGVLVAGESISPPPKKTLVKPPEEKTIIAEEEPITIGNFIRYLFIAALIIALVIFVGGQALQMSKGYDK